MPDSASARRPKLVGAVAVALLLAAAAVAYYALRSRDEQPVRIGYQPIALYRHLFTAEKEGFFAEEGVTVELSRHVSANRMMEGLISNQLDVTGLTNLQVAMAVEAKDPGRFKLVNMLVWGEQSYPDYILVRTDSGIRTPRDLTGRTLGLHPGSAVREFAKVVLRHFDVEPDQVTLQQLEPSIMASAVVSKSVDAIYCMDPAATAILDTGQATVLVANPMGLIFPPPVPISGTAISTSFLRERPEDARAVVRALNRAIHHLRSGGSNEGVTRYISLYTDVPVGQARRMNTSEYWTLSEVDQARVQALADRFYELGIVDARVSVDTMFLPTSVLAE